MASPNGLRHQCRPLHQIQDTQPIRAISFHPSGDVYVVGSNTKALRICTYKTNDGLRSSINNSYDYDQQQQQQQQQLPIVEEPEIVFTCLHIHCGSVYCVTFNDNGDLLASGSNDQTVHVIKYNSKRHAPEGCEYKLTMHTGTVRDVCFMKGANSNMLLSAGAGDFAINVTDCNTMKLMQTFRGHESTIMSLNTWQDSNDRFVSGSLDGTIRFWDLRSGQQISIVNEGERPKVDGDSSVGAGANDGLSSMEHHHHHHHHHYDQEEQENDGSIIHHQDRALDHRAPVGVVRVDPTGRLLVSGHQNGTIMLYDIRGSRMLQSFKAHQNEIRTLNFSPKSYYILTGSYDRQVKLFDLQGHLTKRLPSVELAELNDKVVQVAWHPIDYNFVTTCADGTATLWNLDDTGSRASEME